MNKHRILLQLCCLLFIFLSSFAYSLDHFNLAQLKGKQSTFFRAHRLFLPSFLPVQVNVSNNSWVTTIAICNTTATAIPLKKIALEFNYTTPMPTTIWGEPWANWQVASQMNGRVRLTGGTPFTPDLASDPSCMSPLTIQFTAPPSSPLPSAPFDFTLDDGGPVDQTGIISVSVAAAPGTNLPVPIVAINGNLKNQQQQVDWMSTWRLASLPADTYQIIGSTVRANGQTYTTEPTTVTVTPGSVMNVTLSYKASLNHLITTAPGQRTINFVNQCPFPVWFGFISGATPNKNGGACRSDADCYQGSTCVTRGAGGNQCFWKTPVPSNNNFQLTANGGVNSVQIPIYDDGLGAIWSGAVAGRTRCTTLGCETADCGSGTGACPAGRGFSQPATQAEFTFGKTSPDFYDVEIINGMNLPISMSPVAAPTNANPYICGGAGITTAQGSMGGCSWLMQPPANDYVWVRRGGASCTSDASCAAPNKCGLSFNPGEPSPLRKTCGTQLGFWTANQVCAIQPSYGAPFNCQQQLPAPQQNLKLFNLYGCTQVGSCYQPGATTSCCGCANWDKLGASVPPAPFTDQCINSNPAWVSNVQPKLLWIKKACPSIYTHPYDDMSSTFICTVMKDNGGKQVNSVNYNITFCPGGKTGGVTVTKK